MGELMATASALSWAIAVMFLRVGGIQVGAVPLNLFKSTFGAVVFLLIFLVSGGDWVPDLPTADWVKLVASAILGITLADALFIGALNRMGAGLTAIANCLYAPAIMAVAYLLFGEQLNSLGFVGGALVFGGIVLDSLDGLGEQAERKKVIVGVAMIVVALVAMSFGILIIRHIYRSDLLLWVITFRIVVGTFFLAIWGLTPPYRANTIKVFRPSALYKVTIPSGFFGSFLAMLFWFLGFKYTMAGKAAFLNQLSVIFIIILAAIFLKERLTVKRVCGVIVAFIGGLLVAFS